ncbi:MAG: ribonuclease HII [Lachnospiraceae bacterium]|nr:ribonuclease HII [Lachnospiraceae bacterium]
MTKSIDEIKKVLENTEIENIQEVLGSFREDTRAGVIKLVDKYNNKYNKYLTELERIEKMRFFEEKYKEFDYIAGIDEVGRGPLAGPVVTCAVILPKGERILYVNDSKKLSASKREELYDIIMEKALAVSIGMESPQTIDDINILQATYKAMQISVNNLKIKPDIILNDAVTIPEIMIPQVPIIKGDAKSITIASASIIAKVTRDRMMVEFDKLYPQYDFAGNKGYGSERHIEALKKYGPCPIHRRSFIRNFI